VRLEQRLASLGKFKKNANKAEPERIDEGDGADKKRS
jgi:hypothetical protein